MDNKKSNEYTIEYLKELKMKYINNKSEIANLLFEDRINMINNIYPANMFISVIARYENKTIIKVGFSTAFEHVFYRMAHVWDYTFDENLNIVSAECTGGYFKDLPDMHCNILEQYPSVKKFIIDNINDLELKIDYEYAINSEDDIVMTEFFL